VNIGRIAALQAALLFLGMSASAAVKSNEVLRIKVLDSETRSLTIGNDVPKNCDQVNFDAYCNNSNSARVVNTLLVQIGDGPPFRITCTIDARWSRCVALPKGGTFDATREKHGFAIYYEDDSGKPRKQLYVLLPGNAKPNPAVTVRVASQSSAAPAKNAGPASTAETPAESVQQSVKCGFTSTPAGAQITLDGRYVGSTPSVLSLNAGSHVVVISMPGFGDWKRELAVSPESELTVNAILEKAQ